MQLTNSSRRAVLTLVAALACTCTYARASSEPPVAAGPVESEFSLSIGYAHVGIGDSDSVLESQDALRLEPAISVAPFSSLPQLRFGGAFGIDFVLDNSQHAIISGGGLVIIGSADVPLTLLEPEARVSWRQYLGEHKTFFIEPGLGVGGAFVNLHLDADDTDHDEVFDEWETTWTARAFVTVGFRLPPGFAGFQASYMRGGDVDFASNAGGALEEYYIGFFSCIQY
jgi:hypothetical protein